MSNCEKCSPNELTVCQKCGPRTMFYEGCCSGEVARAEGMGVKRIKIDDVVYGICEHLDKIWLDEPIEINLPGKSGEVRKIERVWGCTNYLERPEICRSFDCNRTIREKINKK